VQPTDAFWHFADFFAPAIVVGGLSALVSRWVWRRDLGDRSLWRLWAAASGAGAVALLAGLIVFQRDGKMATYAGMVLACALALWWAGFGAARR
jgi:hypothetical protein